MKTIVALGVLGAALLVLSVVPWPSVALGGARAIPGPPADAAYGKALFAAKGCAHCHVHPAIRGSGQFTFAGSPMPNFSSYQADPAYLHRWLSNPAAIKPATQMPTLDLSNEEINALIAFINTKSSHPPTP